MYLQLCIIIIVNNLLLLLLGIITHIIGTKLLQETHSISKISAPCEIAHNKFFSKPKTSLR